MRICIDPGHGQDNSSPNTYDTGATFRGEDARIDEASINLDYGLALCEAFISRRHLVFMTRSTMKDRAPVGKRAGRANDWAAEVFISLHCNSADSPRATGMEIEYRDAEDKSLADMMLPRLMALTGLPSHGNDPRGDLAVLRFVGPAILIELGFLTCWTDRAVILNPDMRTAICREIVSVVEDWWVARFPVAVHPQPAPAICPTCHRPLP